MLITGTNLTSGGSLSDASSYNTASITPPAGRIVIVSVSSIRSGGSNPSTPSITGAGMTWTEIHSLVYSVGADKARLTVFRGVSSSPSAGAFTIGFSGETQTACSWSINYFTNTKTTGTNGSDAIVQYGVNYNDGTQTGLAVTLNAFANKNNAAFGALFHSYLSAVTAGSNFTELSNSDSSNKYVATEYDDQQQTSVNWTWGSKASYNFAIALELAIDNSFSGGII